MGENVTENPNKRNEMIIYQLIHDKPLIIHVDNSGKNPKFEFELNLDSDPVVWNHNDEDWL